MTVFKPINVIYNKKEPQYMVLNGEVVWQKENPYRVEYTIAPANDTDILESDSAYLPSTPYEKLEVIKNDDTRVFNDTTILAKDIKKIIVHYTAETKRIAFYGSTGPKRIKTVDYINVSQFTSMARMFYNCPHLENFDATMLENDGKVTDMSSMFYNCPSLQSLIFAPTLNTRKVTKMSSMFEGCSNLTYLYLSDFDTTSVTDMSYMFSGCSKLYILTLGKNFSTVSLTDMRRMFDGCSSLKNVELNFLSPELRYVDYAFSNCTSMETINLPRLNTDRVTSMAGLFNNCSSLKNLRLNGFNTSNVDSCGLMFTGVPKDVNFDYVEGNNYNNWTLTELDTGFSGLFPWNIDTYEHYTEYEILPANNTDKVNKTMTEGSYYYKYLPSASLSDNIKGSHTEAYRYISVTKKDNETVGTANVNDLNVYAGDIKTIKIYLHQKTKYITFNGSGESPHGISKLNYIKLDNLTNMEEMFFNCHSLNYIDLSNINSSNVRDMNRMFYKCTGLKSIDLSSLNTNKVLDMSYMFYGCDSLSSLNLSAWDTSSVINMEYMFYECNSLSSLNLSSWDTSSVFQASNMFATLSDTIDWCYDSTDPNSYANWNLLEQKTGFATGVRFPWNLTEYFVEYTIVPDPNNPALRSPVIGGSDCYCYLPIITNGSNYYNTKYETIEITLKDGSISHYVDDIMAEDVEKIRIYYTEKTKGLSFRGYVHYDSNDWGELNPLEVYPSSLKRIEKINTKNFTTYLKMFEACDKIESLDLSLWDTTKVTNMKDMFHLCSSLRKLNLSGWDTRHIEDDSSFYKMFSGLSTDIDWCYDGGFYYNFTPTEEQTMYDGEFPWTTINLNLSYSNLPSGERLMYYLPYKNDNNERIVGMYYEVYSDTGELEFVPITEYTLTDDLKGGIRITYNRNDESIDGMRFTNCGNYIVSIDGLYICPHWTYLKFSNLINLESISIYGNSSGITDLTNAFNRCNSLVSIKGIGDLITDNVASMFLTFGSCSSLTGLDLSKWNVTKCTDMNQMFSQCDSLELLNLSTWDTNHIDIENDYDKVWQMFDGIPTTVNWCYDETDPNSYANFTPNEDITFYDGKFPWNKD